MGQLVPDGEVRDKAEEDITDTKSERSTQTVNRYNPHWVSTRPTPMPLAAVIYSAIKNTSAMAKRDITANPCVHDLGATPKSIAALHSVFPMGRRTANKTTISDKNGSSCQSVKIPLMIVISDFPNRGSSPALINGENQEIGYRIKSVRLTYFTTFSPVNPKALRVKPSAPHQ